MALPSRTLSNRDAALVRALLATGMNQSDVASLFGCNSGWIAEINTGQSFPGVRAADLTDPEVALSLLDILAAWAGRVSALLLTVAIIWAIVHGAIREGEDPDDDR